MTGSSERGDDEPAPVIEPKPGETAPPATSRTLEQIPMDFTHSLRG
jgi:hypothetical protein